MVVNQDHYINEVLSGGGIYTLDMDTFGTPYIIVLPPSGSIGNPLVEVVGN